MKRLMMFAAASVMLAAGPALAQGAAKPAPQPPAGSYTMDKAHTSVTFKVSHMGFSNYTAHFAKVDGKLQFDPANPASSPSPATCSLRTSETAAHP